MSKDSNSPYYKPDAPRSSWEMLRWVIYEPRLLEKYDDTLNKQQVVMQFLQAYSRFALMLIIIFFLYNLVVVGCDIPNLMRKGILKEDFIIDWQQQVSFLDKYLLLLKHDLLKLLLPLTMGLVGGLIIVYLANLMIALIVGISPGLMIIISTGLVYGLSIGVSVGVSKGLIYGLSMGLLLGFAIESNKGLIIGLTAGLVIGLGYGLVISSTGGLAFSLAFYFCYFRINEYPKHFIQSFLTTDFHKTPYLKHNLIYIPIVQLEKKLIKLAKVKIKEANEFIDFLLEHRELQRELAMKIRHSANAGVLYNTSFDLQYFQPSTKAFESPIIVKDKPKFQPSEEWIKTLNQLKTQLIASVGATNIVVKRDKYEEVVNTLMLFKQVHLAQNPIWNKYYMDIFPKWEEEAKEQMVALNKAAAGIIRNPYQAGEALQPAKHQAIFLGREDLRAQFEFEIRHAEQLPLFLIQGQRRVGKTSLLNFLQDILGTGYCVIRQDLQSTADMQNMQVWMSSLRQKVNHAFNIQEADTWQPTDDWLASWEGLSQYILQLSETHQTKIILTFDEYEELHFQELSKQPDKGSRLLGAMRSFSQSQDRVIFMFAGTHLFNELKQPRWSDFFVQAKRLKVGYLSSADSQQLLTQPYEDFPVKYTDAILERIYQETQGHPALLQLIGQEMVNLANQNNRQQMTEADLDFILNEKILQQGQGVFDVFWEQFCEAKTMKDTVLQIIEQQSISDKEALRRLKTHEFIIKSPTGNFEMRVPLFEAWVRKFFVDFL